MTVIAWDGKTLAADRMAQSGNAYCVTKIFRREVAGALWLFGVAGHLGLGLQRMNWILSEDGADKYPKPLESDDWARVLVVAPGGALKIYENYPVPLVPEEPFFAIGSGSDFALAAMLCGKSAKDAVDVAAYFDSGCGKGVDTLTLE